MARLRNRILPLMLLVCALALLAAPRGASAHGHVEVEGYELVIGFSSEPAYQGEPNGLDLRVTNTATGAPVSGLADTLRVAISFGEASRELELRPRWGEEGAYTAEVLPTEAGDYTWRIWGEIEGTSVDVTMTSGPGAFSAVEAKGQVAFPAAEPTPAELERRLAEATQATRAALLLGALGVLAGAMSFAFGLAQILPRRPRADLPAGRRATW
jgi:hypothetical protein